MTTTTTPGYENYPLEMTDDERYLFDLNGYLIIRNVLSSEEVRLANEIIDKHQQQMIERKEAALRNAVKGTNFYSQNDLCISEWDVWDGMKKV
eukprot:CAMPEP_0203727966 /NCGR_PEP_ID=MMETSP0092-20131115/12498_1 /ASSEMBLY_ACC=CAM_ASM_001090 /TAXON_ID=426623 /ORGANISM="Chaetoceros affinis, Strain CCMP159" /LENGTH=92 /DNA_ID=CAMNT_0050609813 /DNA_START=161 /DNA_END=439 /DNA_ORIENTATION=+